VHSNVTQIINELRDTLEEFDLNWVNFEQVFISLFIYHFLFIVLALCLGVDAN
jgi:hypothetical protein